MGYKAYLQRGTAKLNLDASPYELAQGFVPPAVTETPNIGIGTSANQYGGGKLISKRTEPGAYSFSVRVMGSSNAHNEALVDRLDRFIRSGTEAEPVYFCWRPADNVDCEPLYGQWNATRRAKVITGSVGKSPAYYGDRLRGKVIFADVSLVINPPEGKRQRVATATGGVIEDTIGTTDGTSRGVIVAEATVNYITNPIFGHATPLNDWTTGADIISEVVTDGDFVLFGSSSVRLTKLAAGSVYLFAQTYQTANANDHCLSFYAKKSDGSAVTASDICPRYGATIPNDATYTPLGNGWYRVYDVFAGASASAEYVGCQLITTGTTVYVDGFQFEEKAYPTPLAYGDQMGCSWGGTAHDSATTRVAASLKIPAADCIQPSNFTWWIAFRANTNFADHASSVYLLEEATTTANLRVGANGQTVFSDGTNAATGAVTAVTIGQIVIYHATMDSAGMKLYRNGAQDGATQATFVPIEGGTFLHAGSYSNATAQANVTILGAGTYNKALTAAEIALDYANMLQAARGMDGYGGRVDWIPYLWTKDGDDVVDAYLDSTHHDFCVIGSVPGYLPAITEIDASSSGGLELSGAGGIGISLLDLDYRYNLTPLYYVGDLSGTAVAGVVGGQVEQKTITEASYTSFTRSIDMYKEHLQTLLDREIALMFRANDAGDNLLVSFYYCFSPITSTSATEKPIDDTGSVYAERITNFIRFATPLKYSMVTAAFVSAGYVLRASRSVAGSATVGLDYYRIITRPFVVIKGIGTTARTSFRYNSNGLPYMYDSTTADTISMIGDTINLVPGKKNYLVTVQSDPTDNGNPLDITDTLTYNNIYITPRWALA